MTIYELTQAIVRYRQAVFISLGAVFVLVLVASFTIADGGIGWRGGSKYESTFEISVIAPGTSSLSNPDPTGNLASAANEFAQLLGSAEAAEVVGEMTGYELDEPMTASSASGSTLITGAVIGPSPELAKAASVNAFTWLARKIQLPLDAQPVVPPTVPAAPSVSLESDFPSSLTVQVDETLADVSPDLFVLVDSGATQVAAVPVAERSGDVLTTAVTLGPGGSLLLRLEVSDGTLLDTLRLAPGRLPLIAEAYPTLTITLGPDAVARTATADGTTWAINESAISIEWVDGKPIVDPDGEVTSTRQLQVALLTEVPTALQIGGRRGPLMGFTVLVVGLIGILAGVIVTDSWRRSHAEAGGGQPEGGTRSRRVTRDASGRFVSTRGDTTYAVTMIPDTADPSESVTPEQ